ncbi:hypothetical protein FB107DRAFT_286932 [Schizophyllum commune]
MFSVVKAVVLFAGAALVAAESHTVTFHNNCGSGTPQLEQNFQTLHSGDGSYTHNGPLSAAIAYLQTGSCGGSADGCTLLELTLQNPTSPGAGSSVDVSLIPPHTYSVKTGFAYSNGCDGQGKTCGSADCPEAFHVTDDYGAQVQCEANDVRQPRGHLLLRGERPCFSCSRVGQVLDVIYYIYPTAGPAHE